MLGDKIVADRLYRLTKCDDREAAELLTMPCPRSARPGSWPPSAAEVKRLRAK